MPKILPIFEQEILPDDAVRVFARILKARLGPDLVKHMRSLGMSIEDDLRFKSVAAQCRVARKVHGLSLKEAAAALRVPQYRLRPIEEGGTHNIDSEVLLRYVEFLGLKPWFGRWKRRNSKLARRLKVALER